MRIFIYFSSKSTILANPSSSNPKVGDCDETVKAAQPDGHGDAVECKGDDQRVMKTEVNGHGEAVMEAEVSVHDSLSKTESNGHDVDVSRAQGWNF